MGRTLYLNERPRLVVLRDGPSVLIRQPEQACQRIPARLVGRVVIIGNVRIDAAAITLFTEHGIPVVFMSRSGSEVAVAIPYNHRLARHYEEQRVFLENEGNIKRYLSWMMTRRMAVQTAVLKRLFKDKARAFRFGVGDGNYQALISGIKPVDEARWSVAKGILNSLFRGLVIEHLSAAGLDPHTGVLHRRHNFGLALDICHVLEAESDLLCIQFFRATENRSLLEMSGGGWAITDAGVRDIAHRFEDRRQILTGLIESVIDNLFDLMRELRS